MKVLLLDGYNLLFRARSGWKQGDNPIVFNFLRSFRMLVGKFNPDRVYFVLEGRPVPVSYTHLTLPTICSV